MSIDTFILTTFFIESTKIFHSGKNTALSRFLLKADTCLATNTIIAKPLRLLEKYIRYIILLINIKIGIIEYIDSL